MIELLRREQGASLPELAATLGWLPHTTLRRVAAVGRQLANAMEVRVTDGRITPGTPLVRDWGGTSYHVLVLESGYLYQDRRYTSLSHAARDITGAHWSGPRFFGMTRRSADDAWLGRAGTQAGALRGLHPQVNEEALDFNSLDAQREACSAYIMSQRYEGWVPVFVSVTQSFNTTTSMGRLTLNVLRSFGYDLGDRKRVINHDEAETVRHMRAGGPRDEAGRAAVADQCAGEKPARRSPL
jgi:hypothetical protein